MQEFHTVLDQVPATQIVLLGTLALVLIQEGVNGFHDTANAIAAAVYSGSIGARELQTPGERLSSAAVPVSTTHVVTSAVAGSMRASGAATQIATVRGILVTWFTTLPVCFALSFVLSVVLHAALV